MKKQIIIALTISISAFSFAQKKELKAVEKAIKANNYAEAKSALKQAESLMSAMDDKTKAEYYYLNAQALYAGGAGTMTDVDAAIESLGKVKGAFVSESNQLKQTMVSSILTKGNDLYEKQDFSASSKYFEKAYRLSEKDTIFLYYAAVTSVNVQEYDRALTIYEELKNLGYTGIEKQFYAINKESGEEDILDKAARDLYVRSGTHSNPGERLTESKKPEIVKNVALIYVTKGDNEKAIAAIKDAKAESPNDINLILAEANIYFKMGNNEEFKKLLVQATQMDPNNAELQYNLGVLSSEAGDVTSAKKYYDKAIQLNPNYVNAYINMAAVVLESEKSIIEQMNSLGTSSADNKKYDELVELRKGVYKEATPYLEKALVLDSKNVSAVSTLMNIYSILGETAKSKEMKDKLDSMNTEN